MANRLKAIFRAGAFAVGCGKLYWELDIEKECAKASRTLFASIWDFGLIYPHNLFLKRSMDKSYTEIVKNYVMYSAHCSYSIFEVFED